MKIPKAQVWDYFILAARLLLAWTFLQYGYSKLTGEQFGLDEQMMATPIQDLTPFDVSWYLFAFEPFNSFVGVSQIICAILLLVNRSTILGAFLFLPIITTILIIDLSYMPAFMAQSFAWRLGLLISLDLLILWHYKDRLLIVWDAVVRRISTRFSFPWWAYLLLPIIVYVMEISLLVPEVLFQFILHLIR